MKKCYQKFIWFLVLVFLIMTSPIVISAAIPPDDSDFDAGSSAGQPPAGQDGKDGLNLRDWEAQLKNTQSQTGYKETQSLEEIIGKIIKAVLGLLGVLFLSLMIYGGYLWMTASGSEDKITKAKTIITNSTIGLIIVLAAYAITYFVIDQLTNATGYVG